MSRLHLALFAASCVAALSLGTALDASAQTSRTSRPDVSPPRDVPPALMVNTGDRSEPLKLQKVDIQARVVGFAAETTMTMTFYNPHSRVLAGDLYFPLPEGATVSGYGLDVDGKLVDGVVVDKHEARRIFEAEVRKGVDPGLVEWTAGHNFRTRIFPIAAKGTRTVMVRYVSDLVATSDGLRYQLPLGFRDRVGEFHVRVEVLQAASTPRVAAGGPKGLTFKDWKKGWIAETTARNVAVTEDLTVELPVTPGTALVEKGSDGHIYFAIRDPAALGKPAYAGTKASPERIRVWWDASWSRERTADMARESALLMAFLQSVGSVEVELRVFRESVDRAVEFQLPRDATRLANTLDTLIYDGGTQLGALALGSGGRQAPQLELLFSDGVTNFGKRLPGSSSVPLMVVSSANTAEHSLLAGLARGTGGAYFNLARRTDDAAVAASLWAPRWTLMGATEAAGATDIYPRGATEASPSRLIVGRLTAGSTSVRLSYGFSGDSRRSDRSFTVNRAAAVDGDLLRTFWAQQRLADLMADPAGNATAIKTLGKTHGLVTPGTSLLVLERLDQYLEYAVRPPVMLASMRTEWDAEMERRSTARQAEHKSKLESVVAMWKDHVSWWSKRYKYPKGFRYGQRVKKKTMEATGAAMGGGGVARGRVASAPRAEPSEMDGADHDDDAPEAKKDSGGGSSQPEPGVAMRPWDPDTPYLRAIKKAPASEQYAAYIAQRSEHGSAPAFFLDCANFFHEEGAPAIGFRVLSNLAELELEDAALLRVLAHRLAQLGHLDEAIGLFQRALELRPEEPQSYRDLALVLERRAAASSRENLGRSRADYREAMTLLTQIVMKTWDRFDAIEIIALTELNHIIPRARKLGVTDVPIDERLVKHLDMDIRIAMTWDADMTDMDLHVVEPSTEEAYYSHNRTTIGGKVSRDFTSGYGPEVYSLRRAMKGMYEVKTKYFGSSAAKLAGAVTLQVDVFTNYGRPNEKRRSMTLRLTDSKEMFTVGELEF